MAEKKKKKKKHRAESVDVMDEEEEYPFFDPQYDIEGMIRIELSTLTQRAIGCVMGEDLTTEDPWIFINKEKIEDNLELHEESSEFLPILSVIDSYPADEMLLGFNRARSEDKHEFLLCGTLAVKKKVLAMLEQQKIDMQERLKQSVTKTPNEWLSFGSEEEVDDSIIKNTRPLIELEVNAMYPLFTEKKKFRLRLVEEAVDGYIEVLPGRFPVAHVYRKRVDAGVQITALCQNNEAQTNPAYPKNAWTQYKYEYDEPKLTNDQVKALIRFILDQADSLCETIHVNDRINLYENDYQKIAKPVRHSSAMFNRDIVQFRDVLTCKNKLVTDLDSDPFKSGIFASAFGKFSRNSTYTDGYSPDYVNETVFGTHLVLIWCISDNLKPKLLLFADREVNCVRYCPFRKDIVLGGCSNGQIVIWDIEGRLERVETVEILSPTEMKHRMILSQLMTWMKETEKPSEIYPTAVSSISYSHTDSVMQIAWVLPHYEITKNGKLVKRSVDDEGDNLQFMSLGLDGRVLIWDLLKMPEIVQLPKVKKSQRLKERPAALTTNVSDFRILNRVLCPIFKINIKDKVSGLPLPTTVFVIKNLSYSFIAMNPETNEDCFSRTYYERGPLVPSYEFTQSFAIGDTLGHFYHCKFDGHDYDQGQKLNYEDCKLGEFELIHDGPIRSCAPNRLDEDIFLTVGGRVFAIWDVRQPGPPILWRKCNVKYVSGCWSQIYAISVVLQRDDSYMESWDLIFRTKSPGRIVRMTGNPILDLFSDPQKIHCLKRTFYISSIVGGIRIYKIPVMKQALDAEIQIKKAHIFCKRIQDRKAQYIHWLTDWKKKYIVVEEEEEPQLQSAPEPKKEEPEDKEKEKDQDTKEKEKEKEDHEEKEEKVEVEEEHKKVVVKIPAAELWFEKQQKIMYAILLEKKRLNVVELERNKIPLQKLINDQKRKLEKQNEMLANKEVVYNNAVKSIVKQAEVKRREKYEVIASEEVTELMKESYIESYLAQEEGVLQEIAKNQFRFVFDWGDMMNQGRKRRTSLTASKDMKKRTYSRFFPKASLQIVQETDDEDW